MPSTKEQIQAILRSIKKKKSNLNVKTSVFLKKIQQLLFPDQSQPPILSIPQINLLFKGIEDQKMQGLISLCGNQGTFKSLKKSAFYALEIFYRCLTEPKNKEEFLKIFYELDNDQFKSMRLATHIAEKKSETALRLCGIIKEKRYHLNIGMYIYSEESQKVFAGWYKQHEAKKKQEEKKNDEWHDQVAPNPSSLVVAKNIKAVVAKPQKSKHAPVGGNKGRREPQPIDFYDEYLGDEEEYYVDTYVDPFDLILAARGEDNQSAKRVKLENQKIVSYLTMIPSRSIDLSEIKEIAKRIHIESLSFDPKTLMKNFYPEITKDEVQDLIKALSHNILEFRYCRETFLAFHFAKICEMELLFRNMNGFFGKAESVTGQASVGFQLRTKIKTSINKLVQSTNPLLKVFAQSQKTRKIILFLQNNKEFTKLPQRLKQLQDSKDYNQICHLFKKYIRLMRNYSTHPILKRLIQSINHQLSLLRRHKLQDVYKSMTSTSHEDFMKEVIIIAELFEENVIEDYLIDRFLNQFIKHIQSQSSRFRPENINVMGNLMTKKDLTYFGAIIALDQEQTINDGDLIAEYFREKITIKEKSSGNIDLNEQLVKLEELEIKLKQFMHLSDKIEAGELNTYILNPKPEATRVKTNKNNRNFLASTLVEWYKLMFDYLRNSGSKDMSHIIKLGKMVRIINSFGIKQHRLLQQQNIKYFITHLSTQLRPKLKSQPSLLKQDFLKNPFNSNLTDNLHLILDKTIQISNYPLFSEKYIEPLILPFIISHILMKVKTKNKRELLTFSSLCRTVNNGRVLIPYLFKLKAVLGYDNRVEDIFRDGLGKEADRAMKETCLTYVTIISKEYRETLSQFKDSYFALQVLDLVVENIFDTVEFSNNLYQQFKALIIETLINDISYIKNNDPPKDLKKFYTEIELIDSISNRVITSKGRGKLSEILSSSPAYTEEEKKAKNNYLLTTRHTHQFRYQSILDY